MDLTGDDQMAHKLTDLADVCRSTRLPTIEVPEWRTRGRAGGSGYAPGRPTHVMVHHTATPPSTDGQRDVDYIVSGAPFPPVSNLYLDRKGQVWVCAAGPSNTNGRGSDTWGGGVPDNRMNEYAIGIEAANRGTGELWPEVQQRAYVALCAALCESYDIAVSNVRAHFEWTSRKIDPAGSSKYASGGNKWNMDLFRSDVFYQIVTVPPEPGVPMVEIAYIAKPPAGMSGNPPWILCINGSARYCTSEDASHGLPTVVLNSEQYDYLLKATNLA